MRVLGGRRYDADQITPPWQIFQGRFGKRVAVLRDLTPAEVDQLADLAPAEVEMSVRRSWAGSNIDFLSALHGVSVLELITMRAPDLRPISGMHGLVELNINTGCNRGTDLSSLQELKECSLQGFPDL